MFPLPFLLFDKMEVVLLIRQNTLLGTGLTAVFNIVTYVLYVNKLMQSVDSTIILILALVYFVPSMVEMIEEVQCSCGTSKWLFWINIGGVGLALCYIGILWYFLSMDQPFLEQLHLMIQKVMIVLPAVFLLRKIVPFFVVIKQLYNKNIAS